MRASRQDWVQAGMALLRRDGEQALTIERLCAALGLSKGSFYHHFPSMGAFQQALLACWSDELTELPIAQTAMVGRALAQLRRLGEIVVGLDHELDVAFRVWSLHHPEVRAAVEAVDRRRLKALSALYRDLGHPQPQHQARRVYAELVGAQLLGQTAQWYADQRERLKAGAGSGVVRPH